MEAPAEAPAADRPGPPRRFTVCLVVIGTVVTASLALLVPGRLDQLDFAVVAWIAMIAVAELLPVRSSESLGLTVSFPLLLAVAILYPPGLAAIITWLASFSPEELARPVSVPRLLFNRSQSAVAILAASACFHAIASLDAALWRVGLALVVTTVVAYGVNTLIVAVMFSLASGTGPLQVLRGMHGRRPVEFLASYLGLGLLGVVFAQLTVKNGLWPVAVLLAAILLARQLYFRSQALAERLATQNDLLAEQSAELQRLLDQVQHMAYHDPLTGLANRALFMERVEWAAEGEIPAAVLFVDLDEFKEVNDTLGHQLGDRLLVEVATRLRGCAGPADLVARLGGDEFALLLEGNDPADRGGGIADRLPGLLAEPIVLPGVRLTAGGSIGIAVSGPGLTAEELLRRADVAMYAAKAAGKGCAATWRPDLDGGTRPAPPARRQGGRAART
jgi:diguanylate cyclase (GGDEF)-like protein